MRRILVVGLLLASAMGQEILRPTADIDNSAPACFGSAFASTAMTASYDASGTATSAGLTSSGTISANRKKGRAFITWAGASGPYSALTLNVNSSCAENGATNNGGECILRYSLDGGSTWTTLISETLADGSGWAQQTTTVSLMPSQTISQIQVDACSAGIGTTPIGTATVTIWDIWTAGTLILPPAAPTSLVVTAAGTGLSNSLTWTDNATNETSYQINKCTGAACTPTTYQTGLAANSVSFTDSTGVTNSTTYGYQACAVNAAGTTCSTTTFVTTPAATPPASPSGLTTSISNISVILNWTDNANNETGYVVQRCQGAACTPADLVTIAADSISFTDSAASQKAVYVYQVLASNPAGRSGASNQSTVITLGHQPTATSHMISH